VPHHGSLTSSSPAFVNALKPTIAVISAGRGNHYGHPAPEVLQRYEAVGAQVFRTDLDGAVTLETDGFSVSVSTFAAHDF
jgi:beta-lactamase superfamily II metal-dependent hydrolase